MQYTLVTVVTASWLRVLGLYQILPVVSIRK